MIAPSAEAERKAIVNWLREVADSAGWYESRVVTALAQKIAAGEYQPAGEASKP